MREIENELILFGFFSGTSPLYVIKTIFNSPPIEEDVIGAISLIVWSLIVVVSLKYSIFILMADNHGEGDWSNKSSWLSD